MSFVESDVAPDEDQQLAEAMGQDVSDALGEALDLAAEVKADLIKGASGGLFGYIKKCRDLAVEDLVTMFGKLEDADPTHPDAIAAVRLVQLSFAKYTSAVAFAQAAVTGYIGFGEAENLEGGDEEESDVIIVTGAQDGEG